METGYRLQTSACRVFPHPPDNLTFSSFLRETMESKEEFMSLAEDAFSKMKWVELECPDPEASEFTKFATFLTKSNSDQLFKKLVEICHERFSKDHEDEFLVTCGSPEVFSVGYQGFWLISLLEAGNDQVRVTLESFKVGGLGPFVFMGVWGDNELSR